MILKIILTLSLILFSFSSQAMISELAPKKVSSSKYQPMVSIVCSSEKECKEVLASDNFLLQERHFSVQTASLGVDIALGLVGSCVIGVVAGSISRALEYRGENPIKGSFELNYIRDTLIAFGLPAGLYGISASAVLYFGLPAVACAEGSDYLVDKVHTILFGNSEG